MAFGTSATAGAAADGRVCGVSMLRGLYLWTLDAFEDFGGNFAPKAIMQRLQFNGDGTTFNPFGAVNIGGFIIGTTRQRTTPDRESGIAERKAIFKN
jgi:hypothetical protein